MQLLFFNTVFAFCTLIADGYITAQIRFLTGNYPNISSATTIKILVTARTRWVECIPSMNVSFRVIGIFSYNANMVEFFYSPGCRWVLGDDPFLYHTHSQR